MASLPPGWFAAWTPVTHSSSSKKEKKLPKKATNFLKCSADFPRAGLCWVNPEPKGRTRCSRGPPSCAQPCVKCHDWACHEVVPQTRGAAAIYRFPRVPQSGVEAAAVSYLSFVLSPCLKIVFQMSTVILEWPELKVSLACEHLHTCKTMHITVTDKEKKQSIFKNVPQL